MRAGEYLYEDYRSLLICKGHQSQKSVNVWLGRMHHRLKSHGDAKDDESKVSMDHKKRTRYYEVLEYNPWRMELSDPLTHLQGDMDTIIRVYLY